MCISYVGTIHKLCILNIGTVPMLRHSIIYPPTSSPLSNTPPPPPTLPCLDDVIHGCTSPNAMPLKLFLQYSSSKLASCPIIQIHGIACHHDVTTKTLMLSWTVWWKKCQDCHPWHQAIGYKSFLKIITGNLLKNTLNTVGSDITLKDVPILEPFQIQRTKQVRIPFRVVWTHCNYQ